MNNLTADVSHVTVKGTYHVGIPCNDLERAIKFYTDVLGMRLVQVFTRRNQSFFVGSNLPANEGLENPEGEDMLASYVRLHTAAHPTEPAPELDYALLVAGEHDEVVLFQRPYPIERDTLVENGLFHQGFRITREDMERLATLRETGGGRIRFHTGPIVRWPDARTIYLWDSEGNYLELLSKEDLTQGDA